MSPHRSRASALRRLPAGVYGMALAHLGLAVTVVGVALSSGYAVEERLRMAPGDRAEVAGYSFRFEGVEQRQGPNYQASTATFTITHGGSPVAQLTPEKRRYASGGQPMTEAGIDAGVTRDLYASLGEPLGDGAWSVRLYHKPFVRWIWLGALLMAAGGVLAVADRRYRSRGERVPARTLTRGAQQA
jgi:cytochrome c-type biogenesis protein CcmF